MTFNRVDLGGVLDSRFKVFEIEAPKFVELACIGVDVTDVDFAFQGAAEPFDKKFQHHLRVGRERFHT